MILGTGIDLVSISRFQEMPRKERLAERILTEKEYEEFLAATDQGLFLARTWAVKEAVAKSFGTGIAEDVVWKNMRLSKTAKGQPIIEFREALAKPGRHCNISISHDGDQLIAMAVLSLAVDSYGSLY
jgi:holo-[acyl-carrier protein] synthase